MTNIFTVLVMVVCASIASSCPTQIGPVPLACEARLSIGVDAPERTYISYMSVPVTALCDSPEAIAQILRSAAPCMLTAARRKSLLGILHGIRAQNG